MNKLRYLWQETKVMFSDLARVAAIGAVIFCFLIICMIIWPAKARAGEMNDQDHCLYARISAANAWAAVDDAERAKIGRNVLEALVIDMEVASEVQRAICTGVKP